MWKFGLREHLWQDWLTVCVCVHMSISMLGILCAQRKDRNGALGGKVDADLFVPIIGSSP